MFSDVKAEGKNSEGIEPGTLNPLNPNITLSAIGVTVTTFNISYLSFVDSHCSPQ
jgi:hypothetical protein